MNKTTSAYLDLWRIIASAAVLLNHVNDWSGHGLPVFTPSIAAQGVLVFFVLSGFVISYVAGRREDDWRTYSISRASRIYSVALPALILTFVVDRYCEPLPNWIVTDTALTAPGAQFLAGLTFTNEIWGHHVQIGPNSPYWSLGYEVPFYICFGLAMFLPGRWRWAALGALALFGPRIAIMGLIWLIGLATQVICSRKLLPKGAAMMILLASSVVWIAYTLLVQKGIVPWTDAPIFWHKARDLPGDFLVAILFSGTIVGLDATFRDYAPPKPLVRGIQWIAGATFTLYVFHVPVTQALLTILPVRLDTSAGKIALLVSLTIAILLVAELTERRKAWWHRQFGRILSSG